jgi:hypothetical protein
MRKHFNRSRRLRAISLSLRVLAMTLGAPAFAGAHSAAFRAERFQGSIELPVNPTQPPDKVGYRGGIVRSGRASNIVLPGWMGVAERLALTLQIRSQTATGAQGATRF